MSTTSIFELKEKEQKSTTQKKKEVKRQWEICLLKS